jgi:hypothetical protein
MARPRGRPISEDIGDALADRCRKEKRERMRRLRLQRKSQFAALPQPAAKPLQHGECIVDLTLIEDAEVAQNPLALDPCIQDDISAQDERDAPGEHTAQAITDHSPLPSSLVPDSRDEPSHSHSIRSTFHQRTFFAHPIDSVS